jgi:hypothetical protein
MCLGGIGEPRPLAVISRGLSLDVLLFLVLLAVFAAATRLGQWVGRIPEHTRISAELSHATGQMQVRGAWH